MSQFSEAADELNAAIADVFGESVTYIPQQGTGTPIPGALATLLKQRISQSTAPGYFCDVEVDPAIVGAPQRKDEVIWTDGTVYVVAQVIAGSPYTPPVIALHRKFDS